MEPPPDFPHGPFHRVYSDTQTDLDALRQQRSREIWGRTPYASTWPQVEAYLGPLPDGSAGIEFFTKVAPNSGGRPRHLRWSWSPGRLGVRIDGEFAKIDCEVVRVVLSTQIARNP